MTTRFNLTPDDALLELEKNLKTFKEQTTDGKQQLGTMGPDEAFDYGYAAAIFDYRQLTGPAPDWAK